MSWQIGSVFNGMSLNETSENIELMSFFLLTALGEPMGKDIIDILLTDKYWA